MKEKILILSFLVFNLFSSSTLAYEHYGPAINRYEFDNGISSGVYWNYATDGTVHNGTAYYFKAAYQNAMFEWNSKTESNINNGETFPGTTKLELYQGNWGDIDLYGWAEFYQDGQQINGSQGSSGPSGNWDSAKSRLNFYDIDESSLTQSQYEAVATHEVGHCLGLAHEDDGTQAVMHSFPVQQGWLDVKTDDVNGVNSLY